MSQLDRATGITHFKIVYYGPALVGKLTNIDCVRNAAIREGRAREPVRTLDRAMELFGADLTPRADPRLGSRPCRLRLDAVHGPLGHDPKRALKLRDADGIVFVADSQEARAAVNVQCLADLASNLALQGIQLADFPFVLQYNKRDLPTALPVEELDAALNPAGRPRFEAIAVKGQNVMETMNAAWEQVLARYDAGGRR